MPKFKKIQMRHFGWFSNTVELSKSHLNLLNCGHYFSRSEATVWSRKAWVVVCLTLNTRKDGPSPKFPLFPPLESLPAIWVEDMNIGPQWTPSTTTKSLAVFATLTPDVPSSKVESQLATLNPGWTSSKLMSGLCLGIAEQHLHDHLGNAWCL